MNRYALSGRNSEQDEGHATYLGVLELVHYTLDPFHNLHRPAQSKAPGSGEVGTGAMAGAITSENPYSHIATDSLSESSEPISMAELGDDLPALPTEQDRKGEAMIALRGILIALESHEQEICDAWRSIRGGLMPLCDASIVTSLAINSVVALETEFKQLFNVEIRTMIHDSYEKDCAGAGLQDPAFKIDIFDYTRSSIAEDHYILQFWITGKLWNKVVAARGKKDWKPEDFREHIDDAVSDTIIKLLLVPVVSLEGKPDPPNLVTCHRALTSAAQRLYPVLGVLINKDDG